MEDNEPVNETGGKPQKALRTRDAPLFIEVNPVNFRQVILTLYVLLFAGLGIAGGILFKDAHDEYSRLEQVESANRRRLAEAQEHLLNQERVLDRLRNDPAYVDKVIRMRLLYAKPDEYIFRFEGDEAKGSAGSSSVPANDK